MKKITPTKECVELKNIGNLIKSFDKSLKEMGIRLIENQLKKK